MQEDPKKSKRCTPAECAAWRTLHCIARLSTMKSAGQLLFAWMSPTRAAANTATSMG
jgi:hypothetical protein